MEFSSTLLGNWVDLAVLRLTSIRTTQSAKLLVHINLTTKANEALYTALLTVIEGATQQPGPIHDKAYRR